MTIRQKVWIGLAVSFVVLLSPTIVMLEYILFPSLFFIAFSMVPLSLLIALLIVSRSPWMFWSAAAPTLALMLVWYVDLRFTSDPQTPIAMLFVPIFSTGAAIVGLGVYGITRLFARKPTIAIA